MNIVDISEPNDPNLPAAYDLYARVFVLEEEREPIEGFRTILAFNGDETVQSEFGPLLERVAVALDPATGAAIGLANYIVYAYPGDGRNALGRFHGSCQLNFLCVDAEYRGQGVAALLLEHVERRLRDFVQVRTGVPVPLTFLTIEQNDPARMTAEQLRSDLEAAGIAPGKRRRWWAKRGYRRLDFPYQQPALSPDAGPCAYLDYYARIPGDAGASISAIAAETLAEHLRRFFFVSVGKFASNMDANPEWLKQKHFLASRPEVAFDRLAEE